MKLTIALASMLVGILIGSLVTFKSYTNYMQGPEIAKIMEIQAAKTLIIGLDVPEENRSEVRKKCVALLEASSQPTQ